jgi:hypothetical protein
VPARAHQGKIGFSIPLRRLGQIDPNQSLLEMDISVVFSKELLIKIGFLYRLVNN